MVGKSKVSECQEQTAVIKYLRARGHLVFAIPNGGNRNAIEGKRLKAEGVLAGMPDLQLVLPSGGVVWVEMKTRDGGRLSASQKGIHGWLRELGHIVIVGHGAKHAIDQLLPRI